MSIILLLLVLVGVYVDHYAAVGVGGHLCRLSCSCWGWWSSMQVILLILRLVLVGVYVDHLAPVGVGGHLSRLSCSCWGWWSSM